MIDWLMYRMRIKILTQEKDTKQGEWSRWKNIVSERLHTDIYNHAPHYNWKILVLLLIMSVKLEKYVSMNIKFLSLL